MAVEVEVSKRANKQFLKIVSYIELEWGNTAVNKFVKNVNTFVRILSVNPRIGRLYNKNKMIFMRVITKQTTAFYRIDKNKIVILSFFDTRQNPSKKKF